MTDEEKLERKRIRQRLWYAQNREEKLEKNRAYRLSNPEKWVEYSTTEKRKEQKRLYGKTHKRKNKQAPPSPEKALEYKRRFQEKHPHTVRAIWNRNVIKRKAAKIKATPVWADGKIISALYGLASAYRSAGIDVHVDHVVPLRSKVVCGLHVESNLQLLSGRENARKSNKEWPDKP